MNKKHITITISTSDKDIYILYQTLGRRHFNRLIKEALRASLKGKIGRLTYLPELVYNDIGPIKYTMTLSEQKDSDLLKYFGSMSNKEFIHYVKAVLRCNLGLSLIQEMYFGHKLVQEIPISEIQVTEHKSVSMSKSTSQKAILKSEKPVKTPIENTAQKSEENTFDLQSNLQKQENEVKTIDYPSIPTTSTVITNTSTSYEEKANIQESTKENIPLDLEDDTDDMLSMLGNLIDD